MSGASTTSIVDTPASICQRDMVPDPHIAIELLAAIAEDASRAPGEERCGLLIGRDLAATAMLPCRNVAADPAAAFEIDPAMLIAAHRAARGGGPAPIGCWHSHPRGPAEPSPRDLAAAEHGQLWAIVGRGEIGWWRTGPAPWTELGRIAVATLWRGDQ